MNSDLLEGFQGTLDHTFKLERDRYSEHRPTGAPYATGHRKSGVILDCMHDLGHESFAETEEIFFDYLSQLELLALKAITGAMGEMAQDIVAKQQIIYDIRIDDGAAMNCLLHKAIPAWEHCVQRWPKLVYEDTPAEIQEAVLDVAMRRGSMNRHLRVFDYPIRNAKWGELANCMGDMLNRSSDKEQRERQLYFSSRVRSVMNPLEQD